MIWATVYNSVVMKEVRIKEDYYKLESLLRITFMMMLIYVWWRAMRQL